MMWRSRRIRRRTRIETRPDMVQVTFEIPDKFLGEFYVAVGTVLREGREGQTGTTGKELRDWGIMGGDSLSAYAAWRRFSPNAQALFSLLIDNPGVAMTGDEIAAKLDIPNGKHGVAGIVAWPARHCAEAGFNPLFRYGDGGVYWMDPVTARLFAEVRKSLQAPRLAGT